MNWGTKLVIGLGSFMLFILGMGYFMISASNNDGLVDDNYYEQGLQFDQEAEAIARVYQENAEPKLERKNGQLIVSLQATAPYELKLMRKSSSQDDVKLTGNTIGDANLIVIDISKLVSGNWLLELKWEHAQKAYSYKKDIQI